MTSKLDKLNLSQDEVGRFQKAMADPQFRSLLQEYTDELANPAARAEQEAYLREVEERARNDVGAEGGEYNSAGGSISIPKGSKLISPTPIFCIKVVLPTDAPRATPMPRLAAPSGLKKFFINMCICDAMNDINSNKVENGKGASSNGSSSNGNGVQVSLPYSFSTLRPTKDTSGSDAGAYDFVFSSSTWSQYQHVPRYVQLFGEMAVEALEEREGLKAGSIDKIRDITKLKNATFKGGKPPPRLFKLSEDKLAEAQKAAAAATAASSNGKTPAATKKEEESKTESSTPSSTKSGGADMKQVSSKPLAKAESASAAAAAEAAAADSTPKETRQTPTYQLVHRGFYDMTAGQMQLGVGGTASDFSSTLAALVSSRPKQLVLKIHLPFLLHISEVNLDQSSSQVLLSSATYFLLVPLPFPVLSEAGSAAWSNKTKTLTVTMDVAAPSVEEIEKFEKQRKPLQDALENREKDRTDGLAKDEQERIDMLEKQRLEKIQQQRKADEATAAAVAAAAEAAATAAAAASTSPSSSAAAAVGTHGRRHSVLKNSLSSPALSAADHSHHAKHTVRFDLAAQEADGSFVIPERDGPHGPKPVGLLEDHSLDSDLLIMQQHKVGKGHKKKHVPGIEGPAAWTGIGNEPDRRIKECFPADRAPPMSPSSSGSVPASPNIRPSTHHAHASPKLNAQASPPGSRLWPPFTYSQSGVSVVLVVKVKNIVADSVQWFLEDGPAAAPVASSPTSATAAAAAAAGNDVDATAVAAAATASSTRLDVYFSTSTGNGKHQQKQYYRLFLPLSQSVNIPKCSFQPSSANLVLNLVKKPLAAAATTGAATTKDASTVANEWDHLADWSLLGEQFSTEGLVTPLQSPAASPSTHRGTSAKTAGNAAGLPPIEELSLGDTALSSSSSSSSSSLVQEVSASDQATVAASAKSTAAPIAPLQPLPSVAGSSMLNPFIAAAAGSAGASTGAAAPALSAPASSLLFQLD